MEWFSRFVPIAEKEDFQEIDAQRMRDASKSLDAAMRQRAKLACFTMDREPSSVRTVPYSRGYGRARMWEQYADCHRGAVLVFDRKALDDSVSGALERHDSLMSGPVKYDDEGLDDTKALTFNIEDMRDSGRLNAAAERAIKAHGRTLFFKKNTDWQTEVEYRYVVLSNAAAEYVSIEDALVAIVLGMDYPSWEASVPPYRLSHLRLHPLRGMHEIPVRWLSWFQGYPSVMPVHIKR
jgi:hypothetical protein